MNWEAFWQSLKTFFSDVGSTFLSIIKAAIPVAEQAAVNFLIGLVQQIVTEIENGTIPLPVLAAESTSAEDAKLALGRLKQKVAFEQVQAKLASTAVPDDIKPYITSSLINWTIETAVQKHKVESSGNHGNFPGGNSGPVAS